MIAMQAIERPDHFSELPILAKVGVVSSNLIARSIKFIEKLRKTRSCLCKKAARIGANMHGTPCIFSKKVGKNSATPSLGQISSEAKGHAQLSPLGLSDLAIGPRVDIVGVTGSIPVAPTTKTPVFPRHRGNSTDLPCAKIGTDKRRYARFCTVALGNGWANGRRCCGIFTASAHKAASC